MGLNGKLPGPCGHFVITVYFAINDFIVESFSRIKKQNVKKNTSV